MMLEQLSVLDYINCFLILTVFASEKGTSPLPDLPDTLKHKQDTMRSLPAPLTSDAVEVRAKTPPTRAHTKGPTVPSNQNNVYGKSG